MLAKRKVICWDLDETAGNFRDYGKMTLTRGISPLFERLCNRGFTQVVTTAASTEHANFVLSSFGLSKFFEVVFSRDHICDSDFNKYYIPVADFFGIPYEEAPHQILVVGNLCRDAPSDLDCAFVFNPFSTMHDAAVAEAVIMALDRLSDSWFNAHWHLHCRGIPFRMSYFQGSLSGIEEVRVASGFSYWNHRNGKEFDRIVAVFDVPDSMRVDA
jgi:hypothetical protein